MPLEILILLVVGGIAAVAAVLHVLGKSEPLRLTEDSARAAWARHFPDDRVQGVTLAENGHAALVQTDRGPGLLWSFGADTVGRLVAGSRLRDTGGGLVVRFGDFGTPQVRLRLTPEESRRWRAAMEAT